jgi:hypothetical protein
MYLIIHCVIDIGNRTTPSCVAFTDSGLLILNWY